MGISTSQQSCTRWAAHWCHVVVRVSKSTRGQAVDVRSVKSGTETIEVRKAEIVDEDDDDVGRTIARVSHIGPMWRRLGDGLPDDSLELLERRHGAPPLWLVCSDD